MTLHVHHLTGCAPTPLAFYLKGLGVFRILAEQKDDDVRGWWEDEHFCLLTALDRDEIQQFLLEDYAPTPAFNPWGARSGFYPGSSESTARSALLKLESSDSPRLAALRAAIRDVRLAIECAGGRKPETDETKTSLIGDIRRRVRGSSSDWLDAVMALVGEDYRTPALMGTGGNEGSGSYTSNYLAAVVDCLLDRSCDHSLGLFASSTRNQVEAIPSYAWGGSFLQLLPDREGSAWDLLLAIEGAVLFRSAVVVRSSAQRSMDRFLSSPFYFAPHALGSGSGAPIDEFSLNKGRRNAGRGEQWFPIWQRPARLPEIKVLLAEGRCSVGQRRASRPLDAARAIGRLGVATGVTSFVRYGYLQRNNQATHLAVPLGRVLVSQRGRAQLIDDLAPWLDRLHRHARGKGAPERLSMVERGLADAAFAALTHDDSPDRWQSILLAAVAVEKVQATGSGIEAGPIPPLGPEWLAATADGSPTWRLARALGSAAAGYDRRGRPHDSVRRHWLPLAPGARRFHLHEGQLARDPGVVATGRDAIADLAALVERRLIEAAQEGSRQLSLAAARGCDAHPADLALLLAGEVNVAHLSALARAFMAIRWERWRPSHSEPVPKGSWPDEAWMALRLAHLPWPLEDGRVIRTDETIVRRLRAGDGAAAVDAALQRLRAAGLHPPLYGACSDPATARLWAAALALPVSRASAASMAACFESENQKEFR